MIAGIACTVAVLLLACTALLGYGPAPAGVNTPGIVLCIGAAIVWFGWPAGYSYRRESRRQDRKPADLATIGATPLLKQHTGDVD
ncbi:MAG TPA: hypothetical protein VMU81_28420 [Acetobacteraceae bacterium]|jgi:hypothetical protein|nr:hypothetical protein [Acetobacteraceae bacterium]